MKVDTLCSSYQELLLDVDIFGKLVSTPQVSREELKRVLFDEIHKTKPVPKLEDERYKLSKQVSEEYDITNDFEPELDGSEEVICLDDFMEDDDYFSSLPSKVEGSIILDEKDNEIDEVQGELSMQDALSSISYSDSSRSNNGGSEDYDDYVDNYDEVEDLEEDYDEYSDEDVEDEIDYSDEDEDEAEEYNEDGIEYSDEEYNEDGVEYSDEDEDEEYDEDGIEYSDEEYDEDEDEDSSELENVEDEEDYLETDNAFYQETTDIVDIPPIVLPSLESHGESVCNSSPVVDNEPRDLIEFLRKYPRSELSFVLEYFSKKEVEKNLLTGRVVKRGNKLYF